mgnify:CR=1 FL=1
MKALVYTAPETLDWRAVAAPAPGPDERLLTVEGVGICGSDMHAFLGHDPRRPAPLILGHEVTARDADGRRYAVNPLVTCGTCAACARGRDNLCADRQIISMPPRAGGFAERLAMPAANLVTVPDHVGAEAAALAEPIACGWHAARLARDALDICPGDACGLVLGGGAIGLGAALALAAQGVAEVTIAEPAAARRAYLAERCGQKVADPETLPAGFAPDVIIDGVGLAASRARASALVRPGGVIAHIGLGANQGGLDIRRMTLQEITFIGTYTYTAADFRATTAAMFDGRLGPLDWTEARPMAEGARAFADIRAGRVAAPKIILKPDP